MIREPNRTNQHDLLMFRIENLEELIKDNLASSIHFIQIIDTIEGMPLSRKELGTASAHLRSACEYVLCSNESVSLMHLRQLISGIRHALELEYTYR